IKENDLAIGLSVVQSPGVVDQAWDAFTLEDGERGAAHAAAVSEQVVAGERAPLNEVKGMVVLQAEVSPDDVEAGESLLVARIGRRASNLGNARWEARPGGRHARDHSSAGVGRHRQLIVRYSTSLAIGHRSRDRRMRGKDRCKVVDKVEPNTAGGLVAGLV